MNTPITAGRVRAPEVMVSYSSQDRERVMKFVRALRASGVAVWIDQGGIDGAQRWSEEIVNAIEACGTVLLFISRSSMESQNIAKEVALAWEGGKHFLPVALEEAKIPKSMQYQLAGIQYVKLFEGDPDAKFESVLRALTRLGVRVSPYSMAVVSAGIGDREQAFEWLAKACEERSHGLSRLKAEPRFHAMRNDPRFVDLATRAESLALELEEATAEIVLRPPPPAVATVPVHVPSGPEPAWRRLLWPEIGDTKSAREAAGQGVWAAAAIIASFWIVSFLVPTPMMTFKTWWNDPIIVTLIWSAIGFGVQKMSRPAAILGAGLCVMGAWFNLNVLSVFKGAMEQQQLYSRMGQNFPGQPNYTGLYYAALYAVVAGIGFVIALVNASRGTLAYRVMVAAGKTQDKQSALSPADLLGLRRKLMAFMQRIWSAGAIRAAVAEPQTSTTPIAPAATAVHDNAPTIPVVSSPSVASEPVEAVSLAPSPSPASLPPAPIDQFPSFDDAPEVQTFKDLIGSQPFRAGRALAFMTANVVTGLIFMLARSLILPEPMHPVYWQFGLLRGVAVTFLVLLVFRFVRSGWIASLIAAAGSTLSASCPARTSLWVRSPSAMYFSGSSFRSSY